MPQWVKASVVKSESLSLIPRTYLVWENSWPQLALLLALLAHWSAWVPAHINNKQLLKYSASWLEPPCHNLYGFGTELTEVIGDEDTPDTPTEKLGSAGSHTLMGVHRQPGNLAPLLRAADEGYICYGWWGDEYILYHWQGGGTFYAVDAEWGLVNLACRQFSMRAVLGFFFELWNWTLFKYTELWDRA